MWCSIHTGKSRDKEVDGGEAEKYCSCLPYNITCRVQHCSYYVFCILFQVPKLRGDLAGACDTSSSIPSWIKPTDRQVRKVKSFIDHQLISAATLRYKQLANVHVDRRGIQTYLNRYLGRQLGTYLTTLAIEKPKKKENWNVRSHSIARILGKDPSASRLWVVEFYQ